MLVRDITCLNNVDYLGWKIGWDWVDFFDIEKNNVFFYEIARVTLAYNWGDNTWVCSNVLVRVHGWSYYVLMLVQKLGLGIVLNFFEETILLLEFGQPFGRALW